MKKSILAIAMALTMGIAVPAFAEGNGPLTRDNSANSLPAGFNNGTVEQVQAQIRQNWFASQQAQQHLASSQTNQVNPTSAQPNG
jgi:hypothetical protein